LSATFNGERFLYAQLDSLERWQHQDWFVIASDDDSTDNAVAI
jgi:glycosyltransferase involved in cell wall biosynthesis